MPPKELIVKQEHLKLPKEFYSLPFNEGSHRLSINTLNKHTEFRFVRRPYLIIKVRFLSFENEVLTLGVKLGGEDEERVYLRVKTTVLLVSCSVDTTSDFLSRTAYFCLYHLLHVHDYYDFHKYYWPDFFDPETGKSKFLYTKSDNYGVKTIIKAGYSFFYKPGMELPDPLVHLRRPVQEPMEKTEGIDPDNQHAIGYCLADMTMASWNSPHYPFLLPYCATLTKDKTAVKGYTDFITPQKPVQVPGFTPSQERLNELCFKMRETAPFEIAGLREGELHYHQVRAKNAHNKERLFALWQEAFPLLQSQLFTNYFYTYGMKNVKGKPRKKDMECCSFSSDAPELYFLWTDKADHYELDLRFKAGNKKYVPAGRNTCFFMNSTVEPLKFYLLNNPADYQIASFFAQYKFRLSVLKVHYEGYFESFMKRLTEVYMIQTG